MTTTATESFAAIDERLDRIANLDIGGRGVEHLYAAAREKQGRPLAGAAAQALADLEPNATVLLTTGSVSRAWISPHIGENDGPAGAAVIARALALAKRATAVVLAEVTLIPQLSAMFTAAGLTVLPHAQAKQANDGGTLLAVSLRPFTTDDADAPTEAAALLDELRPALAFSTERVGRNAKGIYHSMRGVDFGQSRARIDHVFDAALRRRIPTIAVGDGGNEIGMGTVDTAVRRHIRFGDRCACPCEDGIGAITPADTLVTAACSNWGCYAITAALATRLGDPRLLHTPEREQHLLQRAVDVGLINSVAGIVDPKVDDIPVQTHLAVTELLTAVVRPVLQQKS